MFEAALKTKFEKIFGIKKVTYAQPGESKEQDTLFIEIENSWNTVRDGRAISKVTGTATLYASSDKLPFGYFFKRIHQADPALTKSLFFFDFETNAKIYQNKVQRAFSFVYFFNEQYDPEVGTITEVSVNVEET